MALLIPIGAAICTPAATAHLIMPVLGSILAGAVFGDHISPISDTTILSSPVASCKHIDHVSTQAVYTGVACGCCTVGYVFMGIINNGIISLIATLALLLIVLFAISNVIIQSSINGFGEIVVAGNSAAANIEGFIYTAMNAIYQATISFTSQNYGAGKKDRINKILFNGLGVVTVLGLVCYLAGPQLLAIYTDSPAVIEAGMVRFSYIALPYVLCGIMEVIVGSMRGLGYVMAPMIVSLLGACVLRLIWIGTIFQMEQFHTIGMLYIIYPISWIITIIAHIITFITIRRKMNQK